MCGGRSFKLPAWKPLRSWPLGNHLDRNVYRQQRNEALFPQAAKQFASAQLAGQGKGGSAGQPLRGKFAVAVLDGESTQPTRSSYVLRACGLPRAGGRHRIGGAADSHLNIVQPVTLDD